MGQGYMIRRRAYCGGGDDTPTNWLTFSSPGSFSVQRTLGVGWDGTMYYSTDKKNWNVWDGTSISSGVGNQLYIRGSGNTYTTGKNDSGNWTFDGENISCSGNIENILDWETVASGNHPKMAQYCYYRLFRNQDAIIAAPELPATTLSAYCYMGLFSGTSITAAPKLPATKMEMACYSDMFSWCIYLISPPELPAMKLAQACYSYMFQACKYYLQTAPDLPATTLEPYCYRDMFSDCYQLTTAPKISATILAESCCMNMFSCCNNLAGAPKLYAVKLADHCYYQMFEQCQSILLSTVKNDTYPYEYRIPTSGTGTSASQSLDGMFWGTDRKPMTPEINTTYYTANPSVG